MSLYISCYEDMRYVIDRGVRSPRVDRVAIKQGRFAGAHAKRPCLIATRSTRGLLTLQSM